jgi:hypothetical protein
MHFEVTFFSLYFHITLQWTHCLYYFFGDCSRDETVKLGKTATTYTNTNHIIINMIQHNYYSDVLIKVI